MTIVRTCHIICHSGRFLRAAKCPPARFLAVSQLSRYRSVSPRQPLLRPSPECRGYPAESSPTAVPGIEPPATAPPVTGDNARWRWRLPSMNRLSRSPRIWCHTMQGNGRRRHVQRRQEIERRVHVRMARQALLTRVTSPPVLQIVLNEAILHRPIGSEKIMVRQLERLVEAAALSTVSIRVMPYHAGLHHGVMSGPFVILRFPLNGTGQDTEPPIVYVEVFTGALYLDKPREVDRYDTAFTNIWVSSLDEKASQELIYQVVRELGK
jgi:hypothetical protein